MNLIAWPIALTMLFFAVRPLPLTAQESTELAAIHVRVTSDADTTIDQRSAQLFIPRGAVARGSVVGFGVGGVPAPDGVVQSASYIVTASGGLRRPVVILIAIGSVDAETSASPVVSLLDAASLARLPCRWAPGWLACLVPRPGAYVLDAVAAPPTDDPSLDAALASIGAEDETMRSLPFSVALLVMVAALVGGLGTLLLSRRRSS